MQTTVLLITIILASLSILLGEAIASRVADERKALHKKGFLIRKKNLLQNIVVVGTIGILTGIGLGYSSIAFVEAGIFLGLLVGMTLEDQRQAMQSGIGQALAGVLVYLAVIIL